MSRLHRARYQKAWLACSAGFMTRPPRTTRTEPQWPPEQVRATIAQQVASAIDAGGICGAVLATGRGDYGACWFLAAGQEEPGAPHAPVPTDAIFDLTSLTKVMATLLRLGRRSRTPTSVSSCSGSWSRRCAEYPSVRLPARSILPCGCPRIDLRATRHAATDFTLDPAQQRFMPTESFDGGAVLRGVVHDRNAMLLGSIAGMRDYSRPLVTWRLTCSHGQAL
jgi:hypothetical protein